MQLSKLLLELGDLCLEPQELGLVSDQGLMAKLELAIQTGHLVFFGNGVGHLGGPTGLNLGHSHVLAA